MQLLVLVALMLAMLLVSAGATVAMTLSGVDATSASGLRWVQCITQVLTFMVPVLLVVIIYYRSEGRRFLKADFSGGKWLLGVAGVVVMLLLVPLNEWLVEWNDGWNLGRVGELMRGMQDQTEGMVQKLLGTGSVGGLVANLLVVALIPAVSEELFFRCGVQNLLQRWFRNPHWAIWVTAIVFSLGHGEVFSFMPQFVMGVALGYMYVCGGSLVPNMLAHFVNNAIVVVLYWLDARGVLGVDPESPVAFGTLLTVCCTLAALFLFWACFLKKQKTSE